MHVPYPASAPGNTGTTGATPRITIQCHENEIPPFVEEALEHLYGNLFSLLAYYRMFNDADGLHTYVVRDGDAVKAAWLFRRERHQVTVINEGMAVDEEEIQRFAKHVFAQYRSVDVVAFRAVQACMTSSALPFQRFNCLEDLVLSLPADSATYTASLGKSTRAYVNRYMNKLRREHPSFRFEIFSGGEIREQDIRRIFDFNRRRMESKGKESIHDEDNIRRVIALARERGFVGVITIGGRVCAGTVNYRVRDNYFLETLAHDSAYDDYRLGTLCCYLTICECIARGGGEYHFLWGLDDYKVRLLGKPRDLDNLTIYRSYAHMLRHGDTACRHVAQAWTRRAQLWLRDARRDNRPAARIATRLLSQVRGLKSALLS